MGKQNPFQLDVVSVRLVRDAPIFSEQKIVNPESAIAVVGELLCEMDREVVCITVSYTHLTLPTKRIV